MKRYRIEVELRIEEDGSIQAVTSTSRQEHCCGNVALRELARDQAQGTTSDPQQIHSALATALQLCLR